MSKKPKEPQQHRWRISLRSTPAKELGSVYAPDAAEAVRVAINEFGITEPEKQKRLVAQQGCLNRLHVVGELGGFLAVGVDPAANVGVQPDKVGDRRMLRMGFKR